MNKKIVIAGGTGFVGNYLTEQFRKAGCEVIPISRREGSIRWSDAKGMVRALEEAELLINLAGKSVDCRYTKRNKEEILQSRILTTEALGVALLKCSNPPRLWMNASTATIYRHAEDRPMTESGGEIGNGFSVGVATSWEQSFFSCQSPRTRKVALRMAIVLGKDGGVMRPLKNLVRFGLGGKQGTGSQMFSWIHIEDLFRIILFLQERKELSGVFNCSSPNPVDNKTFMSALRQAMGVKIGLPSPAWLLKTGAVLIRTEPELVLKSRWVVPEKLLQQGFVFTHPSIDAALKNILEEQKGPR